MSRSGQEELRLLRFGLMFERAAHPSPIGIAGMRRERAGRRAIASAA
jgi:hypothetical protein